ncbi:MAG: transcription-repair coupling factor [Dehalococcoidia bacterium]|nr:transcription-repair coupling factor [Dehalococcoidia bacterium]
MAIRLDSVLPSLSALDALVETHARLDDGHPVRLGLPDAAKAVTAALLWRRARRPVLFIVPKESDAQAYVEQLAAWVGDAAMHFPARHALPYSRSGHDSGVAWRRMTALARIARASASEPPLIVASAGAVAEHTLRPSDLGRGPGIVSRGDRRDLEGFARALVDAGYEVTSLVEAPGQAARRGGLVDVFPPGADHALRIEFFGPEVESIRQFDPETQRTTGQVDEARIGPATEWFPTRTELTGLADRLDDVHDATAREEIRQLRAGELASPDFYGPLAVDGTILDHLKRDALIVVDEREAVDAALADLDELATERRAELAQKGEVDPRAPLPHDPRDTVRAAMDGHSQRVELGRWVTGTEVGALRLPFRQADAYAGRLGDAARDMHRQLQRGDRVVVVSQQAQRYREALDEAGVEASVSEAAPALTERGGIALLQGGLPEGWTVQTPNGIVSLQTDRELFGFVKRRRTLRPRSASHRSRFLSEVSPGDFVVHSDHGIARFGGIVRREVDGEGRDYLELRYAADDRLYVPVEQVDRVTRYNGPGGHIPRLTRLGTQEWTRARSKVREAVQIVAQDLLRLYAARQLLPGHRYGPDTPWQAELEASFPYEETPDQVQAIAAVKEDMQSERPMDRVICGDVGFGKTEVAVRAAFKAVQEGYQVAVLVPTTVLAQQHLRTFRERLAGFPVTVDVLSRFRTDQESREIVQRARSGDIDILIGTHRLIEANTEFKNLGLVIIDEEQRFGVTHKERLKRMRLEVDVLTLSATPIPRTLHMALTGIRDMSLIETAPEGRQPVQTYVMEWDEPVVREAILHEIERGGQVFLVHNRVQSIDRFADQVRALVPEARVVVGHGQMPEGPLRQVMEKFADGDYDVLVCTTIIESGIDIPNANTLIVDRSDMLGLAQMYQLRGRVGRGENQAYAYLFHPKNRVLHETAQARLATIFEASELGAGFQVALRDLEIRGAGNLLGAEQSGHIASVGFDLYTEMLAESVEELKSTAEQRPREVLPHEERDLLRKVLIDLPVAAHIPESYVPDIEGRLALYQRVSGLRTLEDAEELAKETEDRLGPLPEPLANLLALVRIRIAARDAHIASVRIEDGDVVIVSADRAPFHTRVMPALPGQVRVGRTQVRLLQRSLGEDWLRPIEALVRLIGGAPAQQPVVA